MLVSLLFASTTLMASEKIVLPDVGEVDAPTARKILGAFKAHTTYGAEFGTEVPGKSLAQHLADVDTTDKLRAALGPKAALIPAAGTGGKSMKEHLQDLKTAQELEDALVEADIFDQPVVVDMVKAHDATTEALVEQANKLRIEFRKEYKQTAEAFAAVIADFISGPNKGDIYAALAASTDSVIKKIAAAHPEPVAPKTDKKDALELLQKDKSFEEALTTLLTNDSNKIAAAAMQTSMSRKKGQATADDLKTAAALALGAKGIGDGKVANVPATVPLDALSKAVLDLTQHNTALKVAKDEADTEASSPSGAVVAVPFSFD